MNFTKAQEAREEESDLFKSKDEKINVSMKKLLDLRKACVNNLNSKAGDANRATLFLIDQLCNGHFA